MLGQSAREVGDKQIVRVIPLRCRNKYDWEDLDTESYEMSLRYLGMTHSVP